MLLVDVTILNVNRKLFSITFAFTEAKQCDSWGRFLANLFLALCESTNLTIVSDWKKGLIPTLASTIPIAHRCYFCCHFAKNIKLSFIDTTTAMKSWCATKAYKSM